MSDYNVMLFAKYFRIKCERTCEYELRFLVSMWIMYVFLENSLHWDHKIKYNSFIYLLNLLIFVDKRIHNDMMSLIICRMLFIAKIFKSFI